MKAPFNFIPLATQVFYPYWADQVSHDIPFKESYSGKIDITVTAKSPIFIRNGHGKTEDNSFSHFDIINKDGNKETKYFIPGSSLKGSIRNVLKILSFGKMQIDKNAAYAQRDWYNSQIYPLKSQQNKIRGGWLIEKNGEYKIIECKKIHRIALSRIQEKFGCDRLMDFDRNNNTFNLNSIQTLNDVKYDPKTALYKYKLLEANGIDIINKSFSFQKINYGGRGTSKVKFSDGKKTFKGYIVLTGQNNKTKWKTKDELDSTEIKGQSGRKRGDGKFYEFVFEKHQDGNNPSVFTISDDLFKKYDQYIYKDNPDWLEGKKKMRQSPGMPIFFRVKEQDANSIQDFGIAYLYKLPYDKGPYELMSEELGSNFNESQPDLAEVMFGYSNIDKSIKGRIHFSHLIGENCKIGEELPIILSSPKPSYYPIYIKQDNSNNGYRTYNDGTIAGWKRYILRDKKIQPDNTIGDNDKSNCSSIITPINKGTFNGSVTFHNLNDIELGALLSALTFHGNKNCYHQIGQGKPYGMGRISITPNKLFINNTVWKDEIYDYMAKFEAFMEYYGIDWRNSQSIKELFAISSNIIPLKNSNKYDYMVMNIKGKNEFTTAKNDKKQLELFSKKNNINFIFSIPEDTLIEQRKNLTNDCNKLIEQATLAKNNNKADESKKWFSLAKKKYPAKMNNQTWESL